MPVYGQSENRSSQDTALAASLDALTAGQVYYTFGLVDINGKQVGPNGAGWNTPAAAMMAIDQTHAATGFVSAAGLGRVSPAFTFQYARAIAGPDNAGTVISDHGYGGRYISEWEIADPSPIGRNQRYWMRESKRLADDFGVTITCPYVFWWQGMSAKSQTTPVYATDFDDAHGELIAECNTLFGSTPTLVAVVNGADSNSTNDPGQNYLPETQYDLVLQYGGIIATHQRLFPTEDGNGHPEPKIKMLIGETAAWAVSEVEAGNPWNITYSLVKSGATVTITFNLRPGETLMERPNLYANFGGAATCPNYGFEADGGISAVVPNFAGNTVVVTLTNPNATWFRLAKQVQNTLDGSQYIDSNGQYMSAHRCTLFGSHTKASELVPGEMMYRPVPAIGGTFSGNTFTSNSTA